MSIKLNGSTSGSVELDVPAAVSGGDIALTLPTTVGSAGQVLRNGTTAGTFEFGGGNILQVKQTYLDTTSSQSVTANTITEISGLSVDITPTTTTSKMLVFVRWNGEPSANNNACIFGLRRDSSDIGNPASAGSRTPAMQIIAQGYWTADNDSTPDSASYFFLDESRTASLSQITYKATVRNNNNITLYNQRTVADSDGVGYERLTSSIMVMEVAA